MKLFWLDNETTGLDPIRHDIIQLAGLIDIDGEIKEEINLFMQPQPGAPVSSEALEINKRTIEEIREFPFPRDQHTLLTMTLGRYIDRYDKTDKMIIAGQNPKFDIEFLKSFFEKNNDKFFGSFFDYHYIDTVTIGGLINYFKNNPLPNLKLESLCKYFKIDFKAHDALADIKATREVFLKFGREFLK